MPLFFIFLLPLTRGMLETVALMISVGVIAGLATDELVIFDSFYFKSVRHHVLNANLSLF